MQAKKVNLYQLFLKFLHSIVASILENNLPQIQLQIP